MGCDKCCNPCNRCGEKRKRCKCPPPPPLPPTVSSVSFLATDTGSWANSSSPAIFAGCATPGINGPILSAYLVVAGTLTPFAPAAVQATLGTATCTAPSTSLVFYVPSATAAALVSSGAATLVGTVLTVATGVTISFVVTSATLPPAPLPFPPFPLPGPFPPLPCGCGRD